MNFKNSLHYSHLVGVEGRSGRRKEHIRLMLHPELTWLSFFPQQSFAMDSAYSIPILPELEEANGGEASEEKASNDDRKTTFLLASMMSCNRNISYFSVAVFSWAKCKAQNYANCRIMQHVKFAKCKIIVLQICITHTLHICSALPGCHSWIQIYSYICLSVIKTIRIEKG